MSTARRKQHQEKVMWEQFDKTFLRTIQTLKDTGRGPYSPGPWWPTDHPKYRPEPPPRNG